MADIDFYYPFDSVDGDRKTTAATERRFFGALFTDGAVGAGAFPLTQVSEGVFRIGAGVAIVKGAIGGIVSAKQITVRPALGAVMYIVLRLDTNGEGRKITLEAVSSLEKDSMEQLEQGGMHDLPLYSVEGMTGGAYGILDQRKYCTSFDNAIYSAEFKALMNSMKAEGNTDLEAMRANFNAAIDEANAANAGLYGAAGRQGFINPCFMVNQRGRESYGLTSGTAYTFDRWQARIGGAAAASPTMFERVQDGARTALKIGFPGFVSGNAAAAVIAQNIEGGVRTFCAGARQFTVSFDAKASEACKIAVEPTQYAASGGAGVSIAAQTANVTTAWKRFSFTFTGSVTPTAAQLSDVLKVAFFFAWRGYSDRFGSDQTAARTLYLANMQINEGSAALPCYVKPYADELEACQRYYVALGYVSLAVGATLAATNQVITSPLPITRRLYRMPAATPIDRAGVSGVASAEIAAGGWRNGLACTISNNSEDAPVFVITNTDASAVTRVNFSGLALDAEITD